MKRIVSPMPAGSGAIVLHRNLETALPGYHVAPYNPRLEWLPPLLWSKRPSDALVVHTTPDHACFTSPPSVPLVITFHNYLLDRCMRPYSSLLQRLHYGTDLQLWTRCALRRARAVTAVSRFTAELVATDMRFDGDIRVIPNGVDARRFRPSQKGRDGALKVLFSGNMTQRKGAHWLQPIAEHLDAGIRIFCATGLRSERRRWQTSNIEFLGHIPWQDMPQLYRSVDVLLMPTVREGMSLAVLEAMACGLPVVASDCSSLPEQIHPGKGGFLCRVGAADEFADALNELNGDPQLRRAMGQYNRGRVESEYTLDTMVRRYGELFEEVLDRPLVS